jgi:tetratricopeptide (TPR) repeat protein
MVNALRRSLEIIAAAVLLVAVSLLLSSCGDDGGGPGLTAEELNEEGWGSYALGEYSEARGLFQDALGLDPDYPEAQLGLAWTEAQLGNYAASVSGHGAVVASGEYVTDAFAGRAAASLELPDFLTAIESADSALTRDPDYFFSRQPAYDYGDLRLILAQSHFALAHYDSAQEQVDLIDPSNGLDPADPGSWAVGDTSYPTYEAALAVLIELLWSLEGGL